MLKKSSDNDISFVKTIFYLLTGLFLLSPVGNPWYFCWIIPFLCFFHNASLIFLSGIIVLSYLSFTRDLGDFSLGNFEISKLIVYQYFPFYLMLIGEYFYNKSKILKRV